MITIVKFKAFDRMHTQNFYKGESLEQIHAQLFDACGTYVPMEIISCGCEQNLPLSLLTDIQANSELKPASQPLPPEKIEEVNLQREKTKTR